MGEAKRRKQGDDALRRSLEEHVPRVSQALRKLATAASGHLGTDCYIHAEIGQLLLKDCGIESSPVYGFAAWRIGSGDGDVVSHSPRDVGHLPPGAEGFSYHAWLESSGFLIDFTTYQLRKKAADLDAADGGRTSVDWCPDFLLLPRYRVHSYKEVAQAAGPGVAYYEARPELVNMLRSRFTLDPTDVQAARLILSNPDVNVFGPNDVAPRG